MKEIANMPIESFHPSRNEKFTAEASGRVGRKIPNNNNPRPKKAKPSQANPGGCHSYE